MSNLFRSTVIKGNRLTDFAQSTATVGIVIPFGHGEFVTDGNVIWAALPPKEHVSRKRQGKGGVKQETYTYTMSYAVAFALGELYGYKWIKRNGKVVYTTDPNAPIDDRAYAQKWLQKATLYYGRRSQLPDSTIESYEGSGRVSAFRDIGYIVVEDDDVTEGGGAVPTYEACVVATPPEAYLTSKPYPQYVVDRATVAAKPTGGLLKLILKEAVVEADSAFIGAVPTGGALRNVYLEARAERETIFLGAVPTGGLLLNATKEAAVEADSAFVGAVPTGGTLKAVPQAKAQTDATIGAVPTGGELWLLVNPNKDDFDTNSIADYTQYADTTANWSIAGGFLSATYGTQSILTRNGVVFADGEVSCVVTEAQDSGLVLRLVDNLNYYVATIYDNSSSNSSQRSHVGLFKRVGGSFTQLGIYTAIPAFNRGTPTTLAFSASGSNLTVKVDGVTYISVTDGSISSAGGCGPRMNGSGSIKFDSFTWP